MPDVVVESNNGLNHKTVISRVVQQKDGSYLVNLLNVGHNPAKIKLILKGGTPASVKNLMTSNKVETEFDLASEEVLLLEVK